ncbi:MAG: hypothetical protein V4714_15770 [Bacteroidota bacterium]
MKNLSEEEIQKILEQSNNYSDPALEELFQQHEEAKIYRLLFEGLEEAPAFQLSENFSANIIGKISERRKYSLARIWGSVLVCLIATFALAFSVIASHNHPDFNRALAALLAFKWEAVAILGIILIIQMADHFLLKNDKRTIEVDQSYP